jgi:hypothetical protein
VDGAVLAHGSGIDELIIFGIPVIFGLGFWLITRQRPPDDEDQDDTSE